MLAKNNGFRSDGYMRQGVLITNGVILERHEMMTVNFLLRLGLNIELIPKSNKAGVRTPDLRMEGLEWEMKRGTGFAGSRKVFFTFKANKKSKDYN